MSLHKTVLVSCHIQDSPQALPLGTSILKSYIHKDKNINVVLLDFYLNQNPEQAAEEILSEKPHSVGFSMYIWNRIFFEKTAKIIKKENKDIKIFAGGAEVTATAEEMVKNENFDYLLPGEGEIPFKNLMNYFLLNAHENLDKIIKKDHLIDLNQIPSPYLTDILDPSAWDGILWELSRGCPFNCSFCCESRGIDGVRYFNEDRIINELKLFEEKEINQIFVLDPTFNVSKTRALKILSLINEHAPHIHYTFEIRAELLDEELAQKFSELNCSLQIGLQSADNNILMKLNRTINRDRFSEKIALLNKYGAVFGLDLIFGLPGDTKKGFLESLDFAMYQIPNHLDIFRLSIFPGTELYEDADTFNIKFLNKTPYSVLSTEDFDENELNELEKLSVAVDHFYNKGRAAGWFLSVSEFLGFTPSEFFDKFSIFLQSTDIKKNDYFELQNQFLIDLFTIENKTSYLAVAIDLSLFHHLYGEAVHSQSLIPLNEEQKEFNPRFIYKKNTLLKHGIFSYDITLYSELGMIEIESFTHNYFNEVSYGIIFNNGYEVLTMAVEVNLYKFIIAFDGKKTVNEILDLTKLKIDEVQDLIDFLIEAKLIIPQ